MKIAISLFVFILVVAAFISLPYLRNIQWAETKTSKAQLVEIDPSLEEEIKLEMKTDLGRYAKDSGIRYLTKVPSTTVELEASFRQRRGDTCETVELKQPIASSSFQLQLTQGDRFRSKDQKFPSVRVPIATIGLNMQTADRNSLPSLSKGIILDYLDSHYVSLQARVYKDPVDNELFLHHRPIAVVGSFKGPQSAQEYVEAISSTIQNVRGLGIFERDSNQSGLNSPGTHSDLDVSQVAVILLRSIALDEVIRTTSYQYDLGFYFLTETSSNAPELHFVSTTNQRKEWLYFGPYESRDPKRVSECSLIASVRFEEYISGGLQPKTSVVRRIVNNAKEKYSSDEIDAFLKRELFEGGWQQNLDVVMDGIIRGKIKSARN